MASCPAAQLPRVASPVVALAAEAVGRGEDFLRSGFAADGGEPDPMHSFACLYALLTLEAGGQRRGGSPAGEEYVTAWLLSRRAAARVLPSLEALWSRSAEPAQ